MGRGKRPLRATDARAALSRDDGPTIEDAGGIRMWLRGGRLHRDDGPAVVRAGGTREWYRDGRLHRDDGPAIERADGTHEWWLDGVPQPGPATVLRPTPRSRVSALAK